MINNHQRGTHWVCARQPGARVVCVWGVRCRLVSSSMSTCMSVIWPGKGSSTVRIFSTRLSPWWPTAPENQDVESAKWANMYVVTVDSEIATPYVYFHLQWWSQNSLLAVLAMNTIKDNRQDHDCDVIKVLHNAEWFDGSMVPKEGRFHL